MIENGQMKTIQTNKLKVVIDEKGAELKSVQHLGHQLEYMWSGDPAFWGKTSPVLFPIVGTLKKNTFFYNRKPYQLSRHGFARDNVFSITAQNEQSITFTLVSNDTTLASYPFHFQFSIVYTVHEASLQVAYIVSNTGNNDLYFSVGGHPAFKVPLVEGTAYEDYELVFEEEETADRWPISKEGLIEKEPVAFLQQTNILPLSKALFMKDAIVLKHLQSRSVQLVSNKTQHGLRFSIAGFPYLGLWAAPGADFLCIEPWYGIADSVDADQNIETKEGIISLKAGSTFATKWQADFF